MANIIGIPSTRVSDSFIHQRLLNQVRYDQLQLFRTQNQLSTGRRINDPSDDPVSAMQIVSLQRLLERKEQVQGNLSTNESFLTATDTALSTVSAMMADVRGSAMEVIGTIASDTQREAAAQQVQQAIQQLRDTGNQLFRGRYLFAGSLTGVRPFEQMKDNIIRYLGNEARLESYADIDLLFDTNMDGSEVFGAISEPIRGTEDLDPILHYDTRLADLNSGEGVKPGSIEVSNGTAASVIDITSCETIGDVVAKMLDEQPTGTQLYVEITPTGLELSLDAGTLSVKEVGGGTTASELGILAKNGVGTGPLVGRDLDPILRSTTRLDDCFGARARLVLRSAGDDNDFIVEADRRGPGYNVVNVNLFDDGTVIDRGLEVAAYDPGTTTLSVNICTGFTRADDVIAAIEAIYDPVTSPFHARMDPLDDKDGGMGLVDVTAAGQLRFGSGEEFDQSSGVQIVQGDTTHTLTFAKSDGVYTVEDLLNVLNASEASLVAAINEDKTGIDVRSRLSGADFAIGENGGTTADQLGIRSFTEATLLEDLDFGRGVHDYEGTGTLASVTIESAGTNNDLVIRALNNGAEWDNFSVSFEEQVPAGAETMTYDPVAKTIVFKVNPGVTTAKEVMSLFWTTPGAKDDFEMQLAESDGDPNTGEGVVDASTVATAALTSPGPDNDLVLKAREVGPDWNNFSATIQAGGPVGLTYDRGAQTMVFTINPGVTTAQDLINWVLADADANADFVLSVDPADGSSGSGTVAVQGPILTAGGTQIPPVQTDGGAVDGADFTITRNDGVTFEIDIDTADTIGKVIELINNNPVNNATGTPLVARLATYGNGIELVDNNPGSGTLTVTRTVLSRAAIDLGLIPEGAESSTTTQGGAIASAALDFGVPNSALVVSARGVGDTLNDVEVRFEDMAAPGPGFPTYAYNPGTEVLTFWIDPTVTTANEVITLFNTQPPADPVAYELFDVQLDTSGGPNNGTGAVDVATATMAGGEPDLLTGTDVNLQETEGLFTALLRLHHGLNNNDAWEVERSIEMLDSRVIDLNFSRAELGARQHGLDILNRRLDDENVELQQSLSLEYDADFVEVVSTLTARQMAFEASLKATAEIFQMSLLDYL